MSANPIREDDVLDAAVQGMLQAAAATSPPDDLLDRITAAGPAGEVARPRLFWPSWVRSPLRPLVRCAAAAVLILLLWQVADHLGLFRAGVAFADVVQRLRQTHSVFFRQTIMIEGQKAAVLNCTLADPGLMRMMGGPANIIVTFDESRSAGLMLLTEQKKAIAFTTAADIPKEITKVIDWYRSLRQAQDHSVQDLGPRKIGDRATFGFRVKKKTGQDANFWSNYDVWVDSWTRLPVRADVDMAVQGLKSHLVLDDFAFDEPLAADLFSLTPPPGYTVAAKFELTLPTADDLVFMLRTAADLNGKVFPDDLSIKTLQEKIFVKASEERMQPGGPDFAAGLKMTNGLMFMHQWQTEGDWRYLGKGVKLGDASRIVCAWRKRGDREFRAVFGDLQIRNVPEAALAGKSNS